MSLNAIINHLSMTDEEIEKAAQAHAEQHFVDNALFYSQEPWDKARDLYAKTLADFAKHCISHQWVSVEERMPEVYADVLVYVPAIFQQMASRKVAYYDGEDWYTTDGEHIRPSRWMKIPQLNPEKEER